MKRMTAIFGGIAVVMFCTVIDTECYESTTALEMLKQKLCVCPCGNPKGGKLYTVPSVRLNWFEAVAHCNSIGMSIATIKDANNRRLLQLYLQQLGYNLRLRSRTNSPELWIAANNLATESGFRWGLTNQEVKTLEWTSGSALRNGKSEPTCVYILGESMQWAPGHCNNESRQFICEY